MPIPIFLALLVQAAPAEANPLARSLTGDLQCYMPDAQRKTCHSIASYKRRADGGYDNGATILLSPQGPVTLETLTLVTVKGEAVCGTIHKSDIDKAKIRFAGRLLSDTEAAPVIARLQQGLAPIIEQEVCTTYVAEADHLVAKATIAGTYQAALDQPVKWVTPGDNYSVAP